MTPLRGSGFQDCIRSIIMSPLRGSKKYGLSRGTQPVESINHRLSPLILNVACPDTIGSVGPDNYQDLMMSLLNG